MLRSFAKASLLAAALSIPLAATTAQAEVKEDFKVCWSIYVGWMPWGYLQDSGIIPILTSFNFVVGSLQKRRRCFHQQHGKKKKPGHFEWA